MNCAARRAFAPVVATLFLTCIAGLSAGETRGDNPAAPVAAAAGHPSRHHLRAESHRERDGALVSSALDTDGTTRLERECAGDLCHGSWFDGTRSFAFGINGTPFSDRAHDNRTERTFVAITSTAFAEPDFLAGGGHVALLPSDPDGRSRYRVTAPQGADLIAVVDAHTHELQAIEAPDDAGVTTPLVRSGAPPAVVYATRAYADVRATSEALSAPAGPAIHVAGSQELKLRAGSLPIIPCRLAGRDAACLIDSGTTPSAVTLGFAERLGREPGGAIEIAGLGTYLTGVVEAGPLEIGSATFSSLHYAVIPHTREADFDVILGSDVLAQLRIELNPAEHTARIAASDGLATGAAIDLDFRAGLPFADVRLGGRPSEPMLVDTGDTGTVSIGYDRYRQDPALFTPLGRARATGLAGEPMDALSGEMPAVDVGSTHLDGVAILAVRGQHQGHLGYGFAARCGHFVLELGRGRVECSAPLPASETPPAGHRYTRS